MTHIIEDEETPKLDKATEIEWMEGIIIHAVLDADHDKIRMLADMCVEQRRRMTRYLKEAQTLNCKWYTWMRHDRS